MRSILLHNVETEHNVIYIYFGIKSPSLILQVTITHAVSVKNRIYMGS